MGRGKKRIPKDLQEKLNAHEAKVEIYAQAMLCGDFERNRIKWAYELLEIARIQNEIDAKVKANHNPARREKYISI